ncbi:bifunctional 3-(3-hydroxy-phenyl)propionate/3-hydroxycinnamic acid hydroxylase [Streptomyces sp. SHP 1-2]|uniref:bifunctional 3-(3-hydroxy-phenyl)propionate/3-hydroxycinnamic acid hydroxylase n=1 Tax=Streptomyces sp. SHP 1-2 TaxID=2769489 RepID=UPI0022382CD3|nr:bifunctional 3-(3-hydroxy-phenyl)propionate/3-hydroxycinnamic acid hydroxylase [Streptomyces sp. SHP 1-2]MCW5253172.1 bifunctional 3-(3-hydroxy-phenyl)propionate/3-hydroxycinnamic acid hydroxylase [Streptomyces sp. SHP 1-2]
MDTYDVAVIGCGPVGLALARLLSMKGLRVAAIDPNRIACQHPRATHLDDETMRILQTLGAADIEPRFLRQSGWTLHGPDGEPFLSLAMPEEESDQGWRTDYQFHQPDFESRLRGLLAADPNVDLWFGWTVKAVDQDEDSARLEVLDGATGRRTTVRAAYAVGADGANSFLRRAMGAEVEDLDGTQRSLIIDIHPFEHPDTLPTSTGFILCEGRRPVTYVPIFPPMLRFEFMLLDQDDAAELERPQSVYELLSRWLEPGSYRIMRTDTYEWHARLVRGWRSGRLLLAGDAAHEMPPMLGQGMCSGLRDAANLAWKLASVIRGTSTDALLDTYESERSPHVRPFIVESARQSNLIEAFGTGAVRAEPGGSKVIERFRPPLGPGLVERPEGAVARLSPQPRAGSGERAWSDDVTGYNFTVVGPSSVLSAVAPEVADTWRRLGAAVVSDPGPAVDAWLTENSAVAAIVRPDRYAYALAGDTAALARATGELARTVLTGEATA